MGESNDDGSAQAWAHQQELERQYFEEVINNGFKRKFSGMEKTSRKTREKDGDLLLV